MIIFRREVKRSFKKEADIIETRWRIKFRLPRFVKTRWRIKFRLPRSVKTRKGIKCRLQIIELSK